MREDLLQILEEMRPDVDFENETALIDDDILTSMDVVEIVSEISDSLGVMISVEYLVPENFNSVDSMVALVEQLQD